ncbi:MAG TPA: hypothetical protein PLP04_10545, partial [Bryobacteraceae bacterium]|nr:hypothetical protein [Bryobacteraceae bacterium]
MAVLRLVVCIAVFCAADWAQGGTEPKAAAADYPVHATAGGVAIGAEYLVHSFSSGGQSFFVPDYLVVEVAVFPPKGREIQLSAGQFTLRINGKKDVIFPQPAGFVAASLKYPDWESPRGVEGGIGLGGADIILGRRPVGQRFPGDPRESQRRKPPVAQAPSQVPGGVEKQQALTAEEAARIEAERLA